MNKYTWFFVAFVPIMLLIFQNLPDADAQPRGDMTIHTVLPYDQIPAIFEPVFVLADHADIHADSPVIGVALGEESRAYSMLLLNQHEIVNDVVNDQAIATTW